MEEFLSLSKDLQFKSILIFLFIMLFFSYYFKNYSYIIILIVFSYIITNTWIKSQYSKITDFNKETIYKLNIIQSLVDSVMKERQKRFTQTLNTHDNKNMFSNYKNSKLDFLYTNAKLIHFIYSIKFLYNYKPLEFFLFTKGVNEILKIKDILNYEQTQNTIYNFSKTALELRTKTLNNLHNFIYSIPKNKHMSTYLNNIINIYINLINNDILTIINHYKKSIKNINNKTKFINYSSIKEFTKDNRFYV